MRNRTQDVVKCAECGRDLRFVASWTFRGLWGFTEVHTYECPEHGPIFVGSQATTGHAIHVPDRTPDADDRDSLVRVPRKPAPPLDTSAVAVPEPRGESEI